MASQKPRPQMRRTGNDGKASSGSRGGQRAAASRTAAGRPAGTGRGGSGAGQPGKARPASATTANGRSANQKGAQLAAATKAVAADRTQPGVAGGVFGPFRSMTRMQWATVVLSLFGLGVSIYLTIAHYDTHITLACSDKGLINCAEVTTSPTSMVFGVFPVAVLGLAFYVFMTAVNSPWVWQLRSPRAQNLIGWTRLGSLIAGMVFVLYLIYAELIDIKAICLWCTSVHVATFLLFAIIVFDAAFNWGRSDFRSQS